MVGVLPMWYQEMIFHGGKLCPTMCLGVYPTPLTVTWIVVFCLCKLRKPWMHLCCLHAHAPVLLCMHRLSTPCRLPDALLHQHGACRLGLVAWPEPKATDEGKPLARRGIPIPSQGLVIGYGYQLSIHHYGFHYSGGRRPPLYWWMESIPN